MLVPGVDGSTPERTDVVRARGVALLAILVVGVVLVAGWWLFLRDPGPGPVQWMNGSAESGYPDPDGFPITWGFMLGDHMPEGELIEMELVGTQGIDVLGVAA